MIALLVAVVVTAVLVGIARNQRRRHALDVATVELRADDRGVTRVLGDGRREHVAWTSLIEVEVLTRLEQTGSRQTLIAKRDGLQQSRQARHNHMGGRCLIEQTECAQPAAEDGIRDIMFVRQRLPGGEYDRCHFQQREKVSCKVIDIPNARQNNHQR